jgi:hypothetical protein
LVPGSGGWETQDWKAVSGEGLMLRQLTSEKRRASQ